MIAHVHYLKGLLRVCAWCRKICCHEKWMPLEQYFKQGFHVGTTHGMCPECLKKLEEETVELRRQETEKAASSTHPASVTTTGDMRETGDRVSLDRG
jgi:hypothetical protein